MSGFSGNSDGLRGAGVCAGDQPAGWVGAGGVDGARAPVCRFDGQSAEKQPSGAKSLSANCSAALQSGCRAGLQTCTHRLWRLGSRQYSRSGDRRYKFRNLRISFKARADFIGFYVRAEALACQPRPTRSPETQVPPSTSLSRKIARGRIFIPLGEPKVHRSLRAGFRLRCASLRMTARMGHGGLCAGWKR